MSAVPAAVSAKHMHETMHAAGLDAELLGRFLSYSVKNEAKALKAFNTLVARGGDPPAPAAVESLVRSLLNETEVPQAAAGVEERQNAISEKLDAILELATRTNRLVNHLCVHRVRLYMSPSSTNSTTIDQEQFRKKVADHYGYSDDKHIPQPCMLTGCEHDGHDLVAGHIIPSSQAADARVDVNVRDVNNPRNGIFWSRAVEGAWTAGIFCFACPGPDVFKFKLLDKQYADQRVQDWPLGKKRPLATSTKEALGNLTWGDLHATAQLQFLSDQHGRPYRKALCFMAHMALLNSRLQNWERPDDVDSQADEFEYMYDDGKVEATTAWVQSVASDLKAGNL